MEKVPKFWFYLCNHCRKGAYKYFQTLLLYKLFEKYSETLNFRQLYLMADSKKNYLMAIYHDFSHVIVKFCRNCKTALKKVGDAYAWLKY